MMLRKALIASALTATLVTAGCEKAADGAFEIDQLEGCVNMRTGYIRSAHLGGCNADEIKIRYAAEEGKGEKGDKGDAGAPGQDGENGAAGAAGSKILSGDEDPAATDGANGDFWLNTDTGELFGPKANGEWPADGLDLVGVDGEDGADGADGADGSVIHSGAADPDDADGANGDYWLNTTTATLFGPKADDEWPATGLVLKGADGTNGTDGAAGTSVYRIVAPGALGAVEAGDLVTVVVDGTDCELSNTAGALTVGVPVVVGAAESITAAADCDADDFVLVRVDKPTTMAV